MSQSTVDRVMQAVLDPGSFVPRGRDHEGNAFGEPLNQWQRRAVVLALEDQPPTPSPMMKCFWCKRLHEDGLIEAAAIRPAEYAYKGESMCSFHLDAIRRWGPGRVLEKAMMPT